MAQSPISHHDLVRLIDGWARGIDQPLHTALASTLQRLIWNGQLHAGVRLPSERWLADRLGVSRNTVAAAYDQLRQHGVLASRQGAGTTVSTSTAAASRRGSSRLRQFAFPGDETPDHIDLRSAALPGLELVHDEFRAIGTGLARLIDHHGYLPAGLPALRNEVARFYEGLGVPTEPDQVLVTSGAQQALRLVATAMLEPGSKVIVEEPTFRGAIDAFRDVGAELVPAIPRPQRLDRTELRRLLQRVRPKLIFIQSTVHNPTGHVFDRSEQVALARIAAELEIPILDDAAQVDVQLARPLAPPIAAHTDSGVITLGSMSKAFWGGIRIGWLRADVPVIRALTSDKASADLGTSLLTQAFAAQLLPRIDDARALRWDHLQRARDEVVRSIETLLPEWEITVPMGGASLWIRLPDGSATAFSQLCERHGISLLSGPTFSAVNQLDEYVRIGFAQQDTAIRSAAVRLAEVWKKFTRCARVPV